jgi:hypothetical protein
MADKGKKHRGNQQHDEKGRDGTPQKKSGLEANAKPSAGTHDISTPASEHRAEQMKSTQAKVDKPVLAIDIIHHSVSIASS